jgi:hypothetical protein
MSSRTASLSPPLAQALPYQPLTTATPPSRLVTLGRFVVRALRISASTIAVVALLRQQWLPAGCFALAWMLILVAPRVFPILIEAPLPPVTPTD